jgi:hypothetical protein
VRHLIATGRGAQVQSETAAPRPYPKKVLAADVEDSAHDFRALSEGDEPVVPRPRSSVCSAFGRVLCASSKTSTSFVEAPFEVTACFANNNRGGQTR